MVTQSQLRSSSRIQIRELAAQESSIRQQNAEIEKRNIESEKKYQEEVAVQQQNQEYLRQAQRQLNEYVEQQKYKGELKSSQMKVLDELYQKAGYPEGYGEYKYISTLREQPEWRKIQAISQRSAELGKPTSQESYEYYKKLEAEQLKQVTQPSIISPTPQQVIESKLTPQQKELQRVQEQAGTKYVDINPQTGRPYGTIEPYKPKYSTIPIIGVPIAYVSEKLFGGMRQTKKETVVQSQLLGARESLKSVKDIGKGVVLLPITLYPMLKEINRLSSVSQEGIEARKQFKEGIQSSFKYSPEYATTTLVVSALLLKSGSAFKKEYKILSPKEPKSTFFEVQTIKEGKTIGTYKLITKVPEVKAEVTTPFKEFLEIKPKIKVIKKAQTYVAEPMLGLPVTVEEPYVAQVGKIGKSGKLGRLKLLEVSGKQTPTTIEELANVPKYESYIFKKITPGGKDLIVVGEEEQLGRGFLETYQYFGKEGKQIQRSQLATRLKKISEGKAGEVFIADIGAKSTLKPFPRAKGKITPVRGMILKVEPEVFSKQQPPSDILGDLQPKVEVTTGDLKLVQKQEVVIPIPKPIINIPKQKIVIPKQISVGKNLPLMVGGKGLTTLPYAATMTYERTELGAVQIPGQILTTKTEVITKQEPKVTTIDRGILKVSQVPIQTSKLAEVQIQVPKQVVIQKQVQQQKQVQKSLLRSLQQQVLKQKTTIPKTPMIKVPSPSSGGDLFKRLKKTIGTKAFKVEVRKKGKFVQIGKPLPLGRALQLGVKETTTTLRQTFRLKPAGETFEPDVTFKVPSNIFTKLKRPTTELEYVERRGMTLKKGTGEIPEILKAQKSKQIFFGGKKRKSFLF